MEIRYNVTGAKRKELVKVISPMPQAPGRNTSSCPPAIMRSTTSRSPRMGRSSLTTAPTARRSSRYLKLSPPQALNARHRTARNSSPRNYPKKAKPSHRSEPVGLTVEIPLDKVAVGNLTKLLDAKGSLIEKALGVSKLPIEIQEDRVAFPWFPELPDADAVKAYTHFISALCEMSKNAKRVTVTEKAVDNEKYAFRCFLLRLGFIGSEYKVERKILLKNLSGSSAFKNGGADHAVSE